MEKKIILSPACRHGRDLGGRVEDGAADAARQGFGLVLPWCDRYRGVSRLAGQNGGLLLWLPACLCSPRGRGRPAGEAGIFLTEPGDVFAELAVLGAR